MASNVKVVSRINNLKSRETFSEINSILSTFSEISQTEEANSVIDKAFKSLVKTQPALTAAYNTNFYNALFATLNGQEVTSNLAYVPTGKTSRMVEYNRMAANTEIDACLDEIADASINFNDKKQIIEIQFNDIEYIPEGPNGQKKRDEIEEKREVLYKEFYKFIAPLKLQNRLHRYVKNFLKTGECAWENIIDQDHPEYGIIDFRFLPTHSYDFAYDKETLEKVGLWVRVLKTKIGSALNYDDGGMTNSASIRSSSVATGYRSWSGAGYDLSSLNRFEDYTAGDLLFLPFDQVTYCNSGEYSPDELIVFPIIEKARRAFNQLLCTEDSIIIYRLARSPTRLVFNVGVGMANNSKGAQQLQQLIRKYNVAKSYNSATGTTNNSRDPHTMTESFWFMKSANGEGTEVSELSSSIDMGELPDLQYFQKKLWAVFKIPPKRFTEPDTVYARTNDNIGQDEYRFCKFVIRIMENISEGLKSTFMTHLTLTGILDKLKIDESFFDLHFVNPLSFELFEQGRVLAQRVEMYKSISENEEFSKTLAMKKFLNMTDNEIEENWIELEKDQIRTKLIEAKADAVVEDEIEAFKTQLQAERAAKENAEDQEAHYDSTEDAVDDAVDTEKSAEVKQQGVDQMAQRAQTKQGGESQQPQIQDPLAAGAQQQPPAQDPLAAGSQQPAQQPIQDPLASPQPQQQPAQ